MPEDVEKQLAAKAVHYYRTTRGLYIGLRCAFADAAWSDWRQLRHTLALGIDMAHTVPSLKNSLLEMQKIGDQRLVTAWNMAQRAQFPPREQGPRLADLFTAYSDLLRENGTRYTTRSVEIDQQAKTKMGIYTEYSRIISQASNLRGHARLLNNAANDMDRLADGVDQLGSAGQDMMIRVTQRSLRKAGLAPAL
ncbi:MAG: hypothetical protein KKA05_02110 [Alphaproteobacteria bacterium]|nr:hypothetical protein [Alphaproteobacteria bacterium]MBU0860167.1 hypothetical protein [Alphaproteobacteria bacterium]